MHSLRVELSRGLREKRFWMVAGILLLVYLFWVILEGIWPISIYYNGGGMKALEAQGEYAYTPDGESLGILGSYLFVVYFPFIAAVAYGHSIIDDRKRGYVQQLTVRENFTSYIFGKLGAISILGGIMGALQVVSVSVIVFFGIQMNPFIREAVQCYSELERKNGNYIYCLMWGDNVLTDGLSLVQWLCLGAINLFLLGAIFGLVAGIIGLWTNNKLMVYVMPIIVMQIWDVSVYLLSTVTSESHPALAYVLGRLYIKGHMGFTVYGDLKNYLYYIFMLLVLACIVILLYPRIRTKYRGEEQ